MLCRIHKKAIPPKRKNEASYRLSLKRNGPYLQEHSTTDQCLPVRYTCGAYGTSKGEQARNEKSTSSSSEGFIQWIAQPGTAKAGSKVRNSVNAAEYPEVRDRTGISVICLQAKGVRPLQISPNDGSLGPTMDNGANAAGQENCIELSALFKQSRILFSIKGIRLEIK